MPDENRKTVHVALKFASRNVAGTVLRELEREPSVEVRLLRGRMAEDGAWFELSVAGSAGQVDALIGMTARGGAAIHPLPACA